MKPALFVAALVLGVHLASLDYRPLWSEELYAVSIADGPADFYEIERRSADLVGRPTTAGDIVDLVRIRPETPVAATVKFLLKNDRQHFPLYYVVLKFYGDLFGDSTVTLRALSLFFWLLSIWALDWLARELRISRVGRAFALGVFALSPTFFFYGQMIREYSFLVWITLVTHAAFLRALRKARASAWAWYAVALTGAFYTSIFCAIFLPMHLGLAWLRNRGRSYWQANRAFLLSAGVAGFLFLPLGLFILTQLGVIREENAWALPKDWSYWKYPWRVLRTIGSAYWSFPELVWPQFLAGVLVFGLTGFRIRAVKRERDFAGIALLVFALVPFVLYVGHDLVRRGFMAGQNRYLLVTFAPLTLVLAQALEAIWQKSTTFVLRAFWVAPFAVLSAASVYIYASSYSLFLIPRLEYAATLEYLGREQPDRVVTSAGKSVHVWVGIARKLPRDFPWVVVGENRELLGLPPGKNLLFLPPRSLVADTPLMKDLEARFTIVRAENYWILQPNSTTR